MNKRQKMLCASLVLSLSVGLAEIDRSELDYAPSPPPKTKQVAVPLKMDPLNINVVSGNLGDYQESFRNSFANNMCLWLTAKPDVENSFISWELDFPDEGTYQIYAVAAGSEAKMALTCNGEVSEEYVALEKTNQWKRISMGEFHFKKGINRLQLSAVKKKKFEFDALEIVQAEVKSLIDKEAKAMRVQPDWFKNAGYGLMFQWTNRATPPQGDIKPWEQKVNDFDLDGFVETVESSGAAYVMWSITWGNQYISAPIKALDEIIAGRTTQRDLLGEMADALDEIGVKLIFYYHYGYDCSHSIDKEWMEASGGYEADKTRLYENFQAIIGEIGERYGDKLHGWWFDGGQRFYNCHFDNSQGDQGPLSAPFRKLTEASRLGNKNRVVAYNSWIKPMLTEYQDYYGGEGVAQFGGLENGTFPSGSKKGLQAHGCFIFEKEWGHIKKNTPIPAPKMKLEKLVQLIEKAQAGQYPLSINLEMFEDGSVSPDSIALLKELKAVVR